MSLHKYTISVFRDMYYHELTTKDAIHNRVAVPLTALSIITTLTVFYLNESKSLPVLTWNNILLCLYYLITLTILGLILYSAYLLFKIIKGHSYFQTPLPSKIQAYLNNYEKEHSQREAIKEFYSFLNDEYRDLAEENQKNNLAKIKCIRRANLCIIAALMLAIVNSLPLYLLK